MRDIVTSAVGRSAPSPRDPVVSQATPGPLAKEIRFARSAALCAAPRGPLQSSASCRIRTEIVDFKVFSSRLRKFGRRGSRLSAYLGIWWPGLPAGIRARLRSARSAGSYRSGRGGGRVLSCESIPVALLMLLARARTYSDIDFVRSTTWGARHLVDWTGVLGVLENDPLHASPQGSTSTGSGYSSNGWSLGQVSVRQPITRSNCTDASRGRRSATAASSIESARARAPTTIPRPP